MTRCDRCPVSDPTLSCRAGAFCGWMTADPPDPVHVRHVVAVALKDAKRPLPPQAAVPCQEATVIHAAPGLMQKAVNFGKAIVTHAVAGFPEADEATFETRLATCRGCPHYRAESKTCGICGCYTQIKLRMATERCPDGRWGAVDSD